MAWSRIALLVLISVGPAWSQTVNRYFVSFKDKSGTPFSITQPSQFLSAKSVSRRIQFQIPVTEEDLPVNPAYVQQVKAAGVKTFFASRWWNGVLIEAEPAQLSSITSLSFVAKVELVAPGKKLLSGRTRGVKQRNEFYGSAAVNDVQNQMIGIDEMQTEGYLGDGISVAIFDSGFQGVNVSSPFQHLYTDNRLKSAFNFVHNNTDVYSADDHGTAVLSIMAALTSNYTGAAPKAEYHLFKTEDVPSEYKIEEYNWIFAAERSDSIGVDVINSSLGYNSFDDSSMDYTTAQLDGKTAIVTRAARKAIERGIAVVVSAGNAGNSSWRLVTPPADASEVIAVGSITASGLKSTFSSIGLTSDGRIKPDVVALGSGTSLVLPNGSIATGSGTSFASPLVAGLAVGLRQKFPQLTVSELYQAIINSADQYYSPDNLKGYGVPDFSSASKYIQRPSIEDDIQIYPNPVSGTSVQCVFKDPSGAASIKIYTVTGAIVLDKSVTISWQNNPLEIDLTAYPAGTYFITVQTSQFTKTLRLIRQ